VPRKLDVAHFSQFLLHRRPIPQKQAQSKSNGHNPRGIQEYGMKREQETHPDALKQVGHEDPPIRYLREGGFEVRSGENKLQWVIEDLG
jgi:hypothetical protein